jgi:hypothetical protein
MCRQFTENTPFFSAQSEHSRFKQAAATFSLSMHKYGRSPLFQDGVSGVHEINTIYKDGGLLGKFFLTV